MRESNWLKSPLAVATLVFCGLALTRCLPSTSEIPFEAVSECPDSDYDLGEPALVVVSTRTEIESLPALLPPYGFDLERALDETDFSLYSVLVAFHGQETSGGYGIQIRSIGLSRDRVEVKAKFTSPVAGATLGVSSPCHVVRVPRSSLGSGKYEFVLVDESSEKTVAGVTYTLP